jgi:soluble lytic murein transglycosylase
MDNPHMMGIISRMTNLISPSLRSLAAIAAAVLLLAIPASAQAAQPTADQLLLSAQRYLLNGYYENAVQTYRMVLDAPGITPEQEAGAQFGLGQAALREGFFSDAVNALSLFLGEFASDPRAGQALFLRGDAYLGMSLWEQAIADFRAYMAARPGMLDSYALERIGDALIALNRQTEALDAYKLAAESSRSLRPLLALRERVAQVYIGSGQYANAVAQYEAILSVSQNYAYRAFIEFTAAQTLLLAGDNEAAFARLTSIAGNFPDRPEAYQAIGILAENNIPLDNLLRGRISYNYGDYPGAVAALQAYSTERPVTTVPAEVHLLLGRSYREIGNTQAALTAFQTIIDQYPTDPTFGQALLEQGRTRFLANDIPGAIERYLAIASTYDYLPEAPEALYRAGFLHAQNANPGEARAIFERLADRYPDSAQAVDGLFLAATAAVQASDNAAAERYYAEIGAKTTGEQQAQALLQVGRLALLRGDNQIASQAFQQAAAAAPDSYFAARARDIINNVQPFQRPSSVQFFFDDGALIQQAEAWLRSTFGITQEGPLWMLPESLAADARLIRGTELWTVQAYDEAAAEFDDMIASYEDDPLASYQLAIYFRGIAAYQDSIFAAANVIIASGAGTLDAPAYIARMRYPAYYLDVVQESASRYNIDPLLMFSLIRHESLFETNATAAAGEVGLTQVIPTTAAYIADELGFPNWQHGLLSRPYVGVEFGSFYLEENLRLFEGNVTAALSGYNAGPGRGLNWLELSGGDHDLFLTTIDISSTRTYVQRIYGFYNIYRALYGI